MKTKNLFGILMLFLLTFNFISCDKEDEDGRKITDYKEYVLTVASEMKPGVIWSEGNNFLKEVYVVKKENAEDWEAMGYIDGFEFCQKKKKIRKICRYILYQNGFMKSMFYLNINMLLKLIRKK